MTNFLLKTSVLLLTATTAFMAGCANKSTPSQQVVVAPNAIAGYTGKAYQGSALVNNSEEVKKAAANLPSLVHFDYNSDTIKPEAISILDQQVKFLNEHSTARVLVAGHTDERGSREYNISLGERRAAAVRNYLLDKGINQAKIEIISFGEEQPIATGSDDESWSKNRRAEFSY